MSCPRRHLFVVFPERMWVDAGHGRNVGPATGGTGEIGRTGSAGESPDYACRKRRARTVHRGACRAVLRVSFRARP